MLDRRCLTQWLTLTPVLGAAMLTAACAGAIAPAPTRSTVTQASLAPPTPVTCVRTAAPSGRYDLPDARAALAALDVPRSMFQVEVSQGCLVPLVSTHEVGIGEFSIHRSTVGLSVTWDSMKRCYEATTATFTTQDDRILVRVSLSSFCGRADGVLAEHTLVRQDP